MKIPTWDEYFMRHVYLAASKSKDRSTKIGAVLIKDGAVISEGYNGICRLVNDDVEERHERPEKYFWFEHGERNAIFNAARRGIATENAILYTQGIPCADCARAVIQSGIVKVVLHKEWGEHMLHKYRDKWNESCARSQTMLDEAGVWVDELSLTLGVEGVVDGKIIHL